MIMDSSDTISVLLVFLTISFLPSSLTFFLEWGPDLEGPWCAQRPPGQDCCTGRDDYCAVPILGTECYCDIFCNQTAFDCCPDFWSHCYGAPKAPTTVRPTTMPTSRPTKPLEIVRCELNGVNYRPGERVMDNCNECTCELYITRESRTYRMRCTDNVCLIRPDLIQAVNMGDYTWRAGNNTALWGMTLTDGVRYRLGAAPLQQDVVRIIPIKVRDDEPLPETFDARRKWPDMLQPIRDQGNCASSWAFSTAAVASDRLSIQSDGAFKEELSVQHILSCDPEVKDGCTGGRMDTAWAFLRTPGVVTETCYPYGSGKSGMAGTCRLQERQQDDLCPSGIRHKETRYKASSPYRVQPLEREIMKEIMVNGPVQAIFKVHEDFYMYRSGVYQYTQLTGNDQSDARLSNYHAVRILGWGVERTPEGDIVKFWICANSWGTEWGENGYFRIRRGMNASDIETYIVGARAKVSGDVTLKRLLAENRHQRLRERVQALAMRRQLTRRRRRRRHYVAREKKLRSLLRRLRQRKRTSDLRKQRRQRERRRRRNRKKTRKSQSATKKAYKIDLWGKEKAFIRPES